MAEFVGLLLSVILLLFVLLPLLTFLRLGRISRDLEELSVRVARLEAEDRPGLKPRPSVPTAPDAAGASAFAPVGATADNPFAPGAPGAPNAPSAPVAPAAPVAPVTPVPPSGDLEERIGGRGLLYTGVLVLLLGVSFFLKYAFDNAWIDETARVVLGGGAGVALIVTGLRMADRELEVFAHALIGTGLAILYLAIYGALNFYALISSPVAFALMVIVTLTAAVLAHRRRAQSLAFIAVGGGLLTPALVGSNVNAQLTLFTYDALLVGGTLLLAFRHRWLALNALSYVGTFVTVVAWAERFYTDEQWLRTLLFLTLFCVLFLIILRETRRHEGPVARNVAGLLSTAPVFYHLAAVVITAAHPPAIHIYLIAFAAAGLWFTVEPHRPGLRLALLLATLVPMFGNLTLPPGRSWLAANVVTIIAVAALHVMGLIDRVTRQQARLTTADTLGLHVTGLGVFALLYQTLQPVYPGVRGALAAIVALSAAALWHRLRTVDETAALHAAALALTLVAIGVAVQFDGAVVTIGWAVEGAAVAWLGRRAGRTVLHVGGLTLWALAALRLFDSFSETPATFTALLNARSFATIVVVGSGYVLASRIRDADLPSSDRIRAGLHVVASALTLGWITAEIQSFWDVRYTTPQAYLYEHMLLSLAWGLYGATLIVAGMWRSYAVMRYIGITVLGIASLKVFFYDLWELGGIYRIVGFIGFGVLLVLVSYLYQRRRRFIAPPSSAPPATTDPSTP